MNELVSIIMPAYNASRYIGEAIDSYRGLAKNLNKLCILFGCANIVMCMRAGRTEEFCNCAL